MKNAISLILAGFIVFSPCALAIAGTNAATYTFAGGNWTDAKSWQPQGVPGVSDNVIIPAGKSVIMPDDCMLGTLTIQGKATMGVALRLSTMTIEKGGVFITGGDLHCAGMLKNAGSIGGKSLKIVVQNFENSGLIQVGKANLTVVFKLTNTSHLQGGGPLMIRANQLENSGTIFGAFDRGDVSIFVNKDVVNNGTIRAADGFLQKTDKNNRNGRSVWIACSSFSGTGKIVPGDGVNGNPPSKGGKAVIGSVFDQELWDKEEPGPPTGNPPDDLSAWNVQVRKAKDGVSPFPKGLLAFDPPQGSKLSAEGVPTFICKTGGGTIVTSLHYRGHGTVLVRGQSSPSWAVLAYQADYISSEGKTTVVIKIPPRPEGLGRITLKYAVAGTAMMATLTIEIYFTKCPVITFKLGQREATIKDDNGKTKNATMPVAPKTINGQVMVPLRFFVEACGGKVAWNGYTKTATIKMPGRVACFTSNSKSANLNGRPEGLPAGCYITQGRMMVPVGSLADLIGGSVRQTLDEISFEYPFCKN